MVSICTFILVLAAVLMNNYGIKVNSFIIQDRNKNRMEFYYNLSGQLGTVMDTMGRLIYFTYNNYSIEEIRDSGEVKPDHGRLSRIIDFSGRVVEFTYNNSSGDLWKVEITSENDEDKADPKFHSRTITYEYQPNPGGDIKLSHKEENFSI